MLAKKNSLELFVELIKAENTLKKKLKNIEEDIDNLDNLIDAVNDKQLEDELSKTRNKTYEKTLFIRGRLLRVQKQILDLEIKEFHRE